MHRAYCLRKWFWDKGQAVLINLLIIPETYPSVSPPARSLPVCAGTDEAKRQKLRNLFH
jgi:hypothetical protein